MRRRLALLLAVVALLAAACTSKAKKDNEIKPLPPIAPVTTTTVVDLSGVKLSGVAGKTTTTTLSLGPGGATLKGKVAGPEGAAVGGATIHVERLVGDATAMQDFSSNADGTFSIPTLLGGRYRVRAYVPDPYNLAQPGDNVFFLANNETKPLDLQMPQSWGGAIPSSRAPNPPFVNEPANLVVQVVNQVVDEKGIVRGTPVPGAKVELFGTGTWLVRTANPTVTDDRGLALYQVECAAVGEQSLSAVVNDSVNSTLKVGQCGELPPPTTTTAAPPPSVTSAPAAPGTTTTTARQPGATTTTAPATTTTTRPGTITTTRPPNTTTTRPPNTTTTKKP